MESFQPVDEVRPVTLWLRWTRDRLKERAVPIVLGALALIFLALCIYLGTHILTRTKVVEACEDQMCLETAGTMVSFANTSADPCSSFYQFACGGFPQARPLPPNSGSLSVQTELRDNVFRRLLEILLQPARGGVFWSADDKIKNLFWSCMDERAREWLQGRPLQTLFKTMGGTWLLGDWNASSFSLQGALKKVQGDLSVPALWETSTSYIGSNQNTHHFIVSIQEGGVNRVMRGKGQGRMYIGVDDEALMVQESYKTYMKTLASLVLEHLGNPAQSEDRESRLDTFVQDAFSMEQTIVQNAADTNWPDRDMFVSTISLLNGLVPDQDVDFLDFLTYLYPGATLTADSYIDTDIRQQLQGILLHIQQMRKDTNSMRILNNYLTWRVLDEYAGYLSAEYRYAQSSLQEALTGNSGVEPLHLTCLRYASTAMQDELSALYVQHHFADQNKAKVTEITKYLVAATEEAVTRSVWMDEETKRVALEKIKAITFKLGYPEEFLDEQHMDEVYQDLAINASDWLENVRAVGAWQRQREGRQLMAGMDRDSWPVPTFQDSVASWHFLLELAVPAGLLQPPIFHARLPHVLSFAALGSRVAAELHRFVGFEGRFVGPEPNQYLYSQNGWWSNQTVDSYFYVDSCTRQVYSNFTQGPYLFEKFDPIVVPFRPSQDDIDRNVAYIKGIRNAFKAYKDWEHDNGSEAPLPGLHLSNDQLFFVGLAQSQCENANMYYRYRTATSGWLEAENRINLALQQIPEFTDAFKCPVDSPMNPPDSCPLV